MLAASIIVNVDFKLQLIVFENLLKVLKSQYYLVTLIICSRSLSIHILSFTIDALLQQPANHFSNLVFQCAISIGPYHVHHKRER